jgi:MFS family permease
MGVLSDRFGRKKILVPAGIFFSLMSWLTGAVNSISGLFFARGLMGFGEGACFSTGVAIIAEESKPERRGLNLGIHQSLFPLIGIGFGAIIATQLATIVGWRWVFFIVGIPGLILALVIAKIMVEPASTAKMIADRKAGRHDLEQKEKVRSSEVFKYRNVWVSIIVSCLFMNWLFVFAAFSTLFLTNVRGLSIQTAGLVMSAWGFGGFIGDILIPMLSDYFGRKPVVAVSALLNGLSVILFVLAGSNPVLLFLILLVGAVFGWGCYPIFLAAATTEAVPVRLAASAVGVPTAIGEIFGAMAMPAIAGKLADLYGLHYPMYLAGIAPIIAAVVALFYIETAPRILAKKQQIIRPNTVISD